MEQHYFVVCIVHAHTGSSVENSNCFVCTEQGFMFCHLHCTNTYCVVCNGEKEYCVVCIEILYILSSGLYMIPGHLHYKFTLCDSFHFYKHISRYRVRINIDCVLYTDFCFHKIMQTPTTI